MSQRWSQYADPAETAICLVRWLLSDHVAVQWLFWSSFRYLVHSHAGSYRVGHYLFGLAPFGVLPVVFVLILSRRLAFYHRIRLTLWQSHSCQLPTSGWPDLTVLRQHNKCNDRFYTFCSVLLLSLSVIYLRSRWAVFTVVQLASTIEAVLMEQLRQAVAAWGTLKTEYDPMLRLQSQSSM